MARFAGQDIRFAIISWARTHAQVSTAMVLPDRIEVSIPTGINRQTIDLDVDRRTSAPCCIITRCQFSPTIYLMVWHDAELCASPSGSRHLY